MKMWKAIWRHLPGLARIRVLGSVSARASRQHEAATRRAQLIGRLTEPEVIRGAILVLLALALGLLLWAGYGQKWTGFQSRTLWNWLELVVVPVSLALAAFFLNRAASNRDRQLTSEREFYALLGPLLPRETALSALRVFILSTLHLLDSRGRGQMLRALYDAGLIKGETPAVDLQFANLRGADLRDMVFKDVNLSGADLSGADLSGTDFTDAILKNTNLKKAGARYGKTPILSRANLEGTDLTKAKLRRAALDKASLPETWTRCGVNERLNYAHRNMSDFNRTPPTRRDLRLPVQHPWGSGRADQG